MLDVDGSGSISFDEVKAMLMVEGADQSDEVFLAMIRETDDNGDGEITFDEFEMIMTQLIR